VRSLVWSTNQERQAFHVYFLQLTISNGLCTHAFCSCSVGKSLDGFNGAPAELAATGEGFCIVFVVIGAVCLVSSFCYTLCWTVSGQRQTLRIQEAYVSAVLRQVRVLMYTVYIYKMPTHICFLRQFLPPRCCAHLGHAPMYSVRALCAGCCMV
jgi:hypothetical protein